MTDFESDEQATRLRCLELAHELASNDGEAVAIAQRYLGFVGVDVGQSLTVPTPAGIPADREEAATALTTQLGYLFRGMVGAALLRAKANHNTLIYVLGARFDDAAASMIARHLGS